MKNKITQKQLAFYIMYKARETNPTEYIPTWKFVGEIHVVELNRWEMASYKCPTRLTDLYQENPNMVERVLIKGKSGAKYYAYRLRVGVAPSDILDKAVYDFYKRVKTSTRL